MEISKSLYETVSSILLREFDENITWNKLGQKILANFEELTANSNLGDLSDMEKELLKRKILSNVKGADPTPNQQYSLWLLTRLANKDAPLQILFTALSPMNARISGIRQTLELFDTLKKNRKLLASDADINRYKSIDEVVEKVHEFGPEDFESGKSKKRDVAKEMQKQAELFLSTPEYTVIIPKTEEASCYYGQNTKWCTAATGGDNMFDSYSRAGNLYIIIPKNPSHGGEKYQVHFNPVTMMNELDEEVDFETMMEKFPEFFEKAAEAGELEDSDYIVFLKKKVKERMIYYFNEFIDQAAHDIEQEAEENDEGYAEYIQSNYKDEDGEVDWERGYEEMPYSEYNPEFSWWYSKNLEDYKFSDLSELSEWLKQYSQYEEPATTLYVGKFFKWVINEKAVENRDDSWYTDSLQDKVKELSVNKTTGILY